MAAAAMPTDADTLQLPPRDLPSIDEIRVAFPDLEILDEIGQGGMSVVYRARQPKLDRLIALKILPKALAATPGFSERFTREGRVLARLSHPNIVAVHDFGASGGFCFLIMEYVDGVNLRQAMRAGRFTPEQALQIIPAICDALQFAHTQGVLHRDIKPENILLDSKGKVKIADFGIAKILDEKGGDVMLLTQSGAKLGTAPYMAPEQIEQPSTVDHRADIYSLGVVFYEMLTGELPLGRFAAPSERSTCNGNVDEVVFRALEKERSRRQQSAGEMKTQIEGLKAYQVIHSPLFSSRRLMIFCAAALLLSVVLGWMIYICVTQSTDKAALTWLILPTVIGSLGVLLCALSLPLWLKLMPRNSIYGVRLPSTLMSDARWFAVNAYFGKHLFWWSLAVIGAGIAGFYQLPRHQGAYPWAALTLALVAIASTVISTLWWMRQHPVDKPALPRNRLVSWGGQTVVAITIAMFIKGFIAGAYRIPQGNEPGVVKNSHWLASHLDTGIATGDLIIFEHESGKYWIARVVSRDAKGLQLKRGGGPDEFFIPWDKIVGKMLFSHYTPDTVKAEKVEKPTPRPKPAVPVTPGSAKALKTEPALRFLRMKSNKDDWSQNLYDPKGQLVAISPETAQALKAMNASISSREADFCWLQLWFQHPDFEPATEMSVKLLNPETEKSLDANPRFFRHQSSDDGLLGFLPIAVGAGKRKDLPKHATVKLKYSIGLWEDPSKLEVTNRTSISTSSWLFGAIGETPKEGSFVTWTRLNEERQVQCIALLKAGTSIAGGSGTTGSQGIMVDIAKFDFGLNEIDSFTLRSRDFREVTFENVSLPPLQ
jgi:serine/threonine protein kinase